jgi:hypothetical protein
MHTLSARILLAGAKRRAEFLDPPPSNDAARAIVLSGARRRNEVLDPKDAAWLSAYCARIDAARRRV